MIGRIFNVGSLTATSISVPEFKKANYGAQVGSSWLMQTLYEIFNLQPLWPNNYSSYRIDVNGVFNIASGNL